MKMEVDFSILMIVLWKKQTVKIWEESWEKNCYGESATRWRWRFNHEKRWRERKRYVNASVRPMTR